MCANAISTNGSHMQSLELETGSLVSDTELTTLGEFGKVLASLIETPVTTLGHDHIRVTTPHIVDDKEIQNLREFIANSLYLPVTIFRERNYIEVMAI